MRSIGIAVINTGGVYTYENDISAEEASESEGSRLQSENGYQGGKKGSRGKTS